ncbi:hypothetical protein HID58_072126, partial [Brassica napus]
MSNERKMCLIKDLKPFRDEWRLTLKLLHSWKQITSYGGDTLECVLVDQTVTDLGPVAMVQAKENDTKRVHFRLRDTSGHEVACCLWGKYAEQFEWVEEANDESIICLIRFAKISENRGEKQITNAFDASLVFLNPTMEEAIDFKQKMLNDPLPLAILDQSNEKKIITRVAHDWNEVDVRCISEILQSF